MKAMRQTSNIAPCDMIHEKFPAMHSDMKVGISRAELRVIYLGGAFPKHSSLFVCDQRNITGRFIKIISNGLKTTLPAPV